ncbi:MAG: COX15/CtaA family protein, partial [Gammaproteobacteria bacterium]|nr:COX15/CtaA family protein [Gammaproteobacteria bacterium]
MDKGSLKSQGFIRAKNHSFQKAIIWQRYLSLGALCFAFVVIGLGALTRLVDAGLGCPDWPGCYGHLTVLAAEQDHQLSLVYPTTPLVSYKAWAEMVHRYCAGLLSVLILGVLAVLMIRFVREKRTGLLALGLGLLALIIYQIMLGRWTVTL